MMRNLMERMPSALVLICAALSFLVPYTVYRVNKALHQSGDPAWKKASDTSVSKQSEAGE